MKGKIFRHTYLSFFSLQTWLVNSFQRANHTSTFRFFSPPPKKKAFKSNYLFLMSQSSLKTCRKLLSKSRHSFKGLERRFGIVEVSQEFAFQHPDQVTHNTSSLYRHLVCVCTHIQVISLKIIQLLVFIKRWKSCLPSLFISGILMISI